jgi:hypothetical protein
MSKTRRKKKKNPNTQFINQNKQERKKPTRHSQRTINLQDYHMEKIVFCLELQIYSQKQHQKSITFSCNILQQLLLQTMHERKRSLDDCPTRNQQKRCESCR